MSIRRQPSRALVLATLLGMMGGAAASTLNQNTSWTLQRPGASSTYRIVAYGDSIYAGYNGSFTSVARRSAPLVEGEYLSTLWGANLEVVRRTKSGARADDVYQNKILAEKSYMQASSTRVVAFEMCGNDYLQARSVFQAQTGTCSYAGLDAALAHCTTYLEKAMQTINQYATSARLKLVSNLYYPGFAADDVLTRCTDSTTGSRINRRSKFLPYLAHSNWRTCHLAQQYGFQCADAFAEFMGADYDSNGDGQIDRDALRYQPGESEADYVTRITQTLVGTLRDAHTHYVDSSISYDYIQSDDTHPTAYSSATIGVSLLTGSGSGSGAPDFSDADITQGRNPQWNKQGHERLGWLNSLFNPSTP